MRAAKETDDTREYLDDLGSVHSFLEFLWIKLGMNVVQHITKE